MSNYSIRTWIDNNQLNKCTREIDTFLFLFSYFFIFFVHSKILKKSKSISFIEIIYKNYWTKIQILFLFIKKKFEKYGGGVFLFIVHQLLYRQIVLNIRFWCSSTLEFVWTSLSKSNIFPDHELVFLILIRSIYNKMSFTLLFII